MGDEIIGIKLQDIDLQRRHRGLAAFRTTPGKDGPVQRRFSRDFGDQRQDHVVKSVVGIGAGQADAQGLA